MAKKRDYYEVLGVSKTSDKHEVKRAYRKLAKKYHPDTHPNDQKSEEMFRLVTEAYNILSNPEKRSLYDKFGHAAFDENGEPINPNGFGGFGGYGDFHSSTNTSDFSGFEGFGGFSNFNGGNVHYRSGDGNNYQEFHFEGGDLNDILSGLFGQGFTTSGNNFRRSYSERTPYDYEDLDIYTDLKIPFTTATLGGEVLLRLPDGSRISLKIKEGTQNATKIRLKGKGKESRIERGKRGDLYAVVQIEVPRNLSSAAKSKLREFERCA